MLTWELVGAVVGAGLASGREVASFFSQYGAWGYGGIIISISTMIFLADTHMPIQWRNRIPEVVWNLMFRLLLMVTGGAMLAGSGEIFAKALPIHGASGIGMIGTIALASMLAIKAPNGLAIISRILMGVMLLLLCLGFFIQPMKGVAIVEHNQCGALIRGMTHGGFNAALLVPVIAGMKVENTMPIRRSIRYAAGIVLTLLTLGNTLIMRHSVLLQEQMPFVRLLSQLGKPGYCLGLGTMYMAILSTLTAVMHGLRASAIWIIGICIVALAGFENVVEWGYPALGCICFGLLVVAKFINCQPNSFQSGGNVV